MTEKIKQIGTYILHNLETDEMYVGSGDLKKRHYNHFYKLEINDHKNVKLQLAFNANPKFDFIAVETKDREEAFDLEQTIINENFGNPLFLNIVKDARYGPPPGRKATEETIAKLKLINLGRKASPETKQKLSIARMGNTNSLGFKHTAETISARSISLTGRKLSEQTKEKIRVSNTGLKRTPETVERIRQVNIGRIATLEARENMSKAKKGKPISAEALVKRNKPISMNGVFYESVNSASEELGVHPNTITKYLKRGVAIVASKVSVLNHPV